MVAEQVIEVPKIFLDMTPQRLGDHLRQPQMVEQLVHVPTVVSYLSLQQLTAEQIVDILVPGGEGLQSSLPRQNSAAVHVEQTVDIPVPGRAGGGGRGGLQGSRPGQGSAASSSHVGAADDAGQGVFSHFSPDQKKCEERSALGVGTGCGVYSIHAERSSNASGAARGCASAPGS